MALGSFYRPRPSGSASAYGFGRSRRPRSVKTPSANPPGIPYYSRPGTVCEGHVGQGQYVKVMQVRDSVLRSCRSGTVCEGHAGQGQCVKVL